jgi:hypothetical protein
LDADVHQIVVEAERLYGRLHGNTRLSDVIAKGE